MKSYKRKVRNCINKNTYRYYFLEAIMGDIWNLLENKYGKANELIGFNLYVLENERFLIKKSKFESAFTVIRKKLYARDDDVFFNRLLEVSNE